jgi:GTP-binding protein
MTDAKDDIEAARRLFAGNCDFIWGATSVDNLPPAKLPEIAFVGRSNAGKSSLLNALTGRKTLARVSHTPGRTRQINFFNLGDRVVLADLPGYGYAKASKSLADDWQNLIFAYLRGRAALRRVALLIDARRGAMDIDKQAMELLDQAAVSYVLVLTKMDQLKQAEREKAHADITAESKRHTAAYPEIFATSSLKTLGLEGLKAHIAALAA